MGTIAIQEFISLDGVFEDPTWTFEFGFDEKMAKAIGAIATSSAAILLGRRTFEMFGPAWSSQTVDDGPGAAVFQQHDQIRCRRNRTRSRMDQF